MAQVKTEHRKGEPSKTTCREICRYYINGKGQCEVIERKMDVIPELERNGFTGNLYGLAPLTLFKAILRDRSTYGRLQGKNRYETLLKSGCIDHFRHFMIHSTDLEICW